MATGFNPEKVLTLINTVPQRLSTCCIGLQLPTSMTNGWEWRELQSTNSRKHHLGYPCNITQAFHAKLLATVFILGENGPCILLLTEPLCRLCLVSFAWTWLCSYFIYALQAELKCSRILPDSTFVYQLMCISAHNAFMCRCKCKCFAAWSCSVHVLENYGPGQSRHPSMMHSSKCS